VICIAHPLVTALESVTEYKTVVRITLARYDALHSLRITLPQPSYFGLGRVLWLALKCSCAEFLSDRRGRDSHISSDSDHARDLPPAEHLVPCPCLTAIPPAEILHFPQWFVSVDRHFCLLRSRATNKRPLRRAQVGQFISVAKNSLAGTSVVRRLYGSRLRCL
jgi:hypothetical protein